LFLVAKSNSLGKLFKLRILSVIHADFKTSFVDRSRANKR